MEQPNFVNYRHLHILEECYDQALSPRQTMKYMMDLGLSHDQAGSAMQYFVEKKINSPEHLARVRANKMLDYFQVGLIATLIALIILCTAGK